MLARFQNDVVEPATNKVLQFLPKGKNMFLPLFVNFDPLRCSAINFLHFLKKSIFSQKKIGRMNVPTSCDVKSSCASLPV